MPIRIAIDARPFAGPPCGYTVYLASIISCLREGDFDITLLTNQPLRSEHKDDVAGLKMHVFGRPRQLRWENVDLPKLLAKEDYELYFTGANRGIPALKHRRTRYVLGLLDVIPYIFFREVKLQYWRTLIRHPSANAETLSQLISVMRADAILTISQQSALDIRRVFHRRAVTAILIRLKHVERREALQPLPQFAYIGGTDFRKKVDSLLRGFNLFLREHPGYRLMLVGSNYQNVTSVIAELGLKAHVVMTGYVDHETKFRVLAQSLAMVFPSLYEGYGMAIAEGLQAGIPVIAGRGGSQSEVGGVGVRPIDPLSPPDIAAAMADMLDPTMRAAWIARGREQLARLTDAGIETQTVAYFTEQARLARTQRA